MSIGMFVLILIQYLITRNKSTMLMVENSTTTMVLLFLVRPKERPQSY